jgi:hypothetical protein
MEMQRKNSGGKREVPLAPITKRYVVAIECRLFYIGRAKRG